MSARDAHSSTVAVWLPVPRCTLLSKCEGGCTNNDEKLNFFYFYKYIMFKYVLFFFVLFD